MKDWHYERTNRHTKKVKELADVIVDWDHEFAGLLDQVQHHGASKFEEPEENAYIHISWMYKCKLNPEVEDYKIPENVNDSETTHHHVKDNMHHPEFWTDQANVINRENRDEAPSTLVERNQNARYFYC